MQQKWNRRGYVVSLRFYNSCVTKFVAYVGTVAAVARKGERGTGLNTLGSPIMSGWARACAAAFFLLLPGFALAGDTQQTAPTIEQRKQPMTFTWYGARPDACEPDCRDWIAAVGVVTNDTPKQFAAFASDRKVAGATVVLDSSGGSVLDAIALGRRWRELGIHTTVGAVVEHSGANGLEREVVPDAYCESMCVFLLLAGQTRYVPAGAHVRVHQIWMGDRADNAKAANYTAQDLTIVQHDIGSLAKFTYDMGGSGDLLSLALSVPPWEPLHELTPMELRRTLILRDDAVAAAPMRSGTMADVVAVSDAKPVQDRFRSEAAEAGSPAVTKATKTADAKPATGGAAAAQ